YLLDVLYPTLFGTPPLLFSSSDSPCNAHVLSGTTSQYTGYPDTPEYPETKKLTASHARSYYPCRPEQDPKIQSAFLMKKQSPVQYHPTQRKTYSRHGTTAEPTSWLPPIPSLHSSLLLNSSLAGSLSRSAKFRPGPSSPLTCYSGSVSTAAATAKRAVVLLPPTFLVHGYCAIKTLIWSTCSGTARYTRSPDPHPGYYSAEFQTYLAACLGLPGLLLPQNDRYRALAIAARVHPGPCSSPCRHAASRHSALHQ
ncbi:hypothetical protein HPB47_022774, partial [Ixodes persulcatus]